jgi:hypothetical protein
MRILGVTASGIVGFDPAYELISTTILSGLASSVTFSSLGTYSSTYKHLQIRYTAKKDVTNDDFVMTFNGDASSGLYAYHFLRGNGSNVSSGSSTGRNDIGILSGSAESTTTNAFGVGVIDILDAYNTSKNITTRALNGWYTNSGFIGLGSGLWRNTASLTSIGLSPVNNNWITGSRFSLYGIKG